MNANWGEKISLISRGARYQIQVATVLMGIIPLLVACFFALTLCSPSGFASWIGLAVVGGLTFLLAASGYALLRKYPANVLKLRHYLRQIAEDELPEKIVLDNSEDDIRAIENDLNRILVAARKKVQLLETQLETTRALQATLAAQQRALLAAERQRVMIHSLGAACHHIGQPATVLRAHLHFLKNQTVAPHELGEIAECERAVEAIAEVLERLSRVSAYRTTPYLAGPLGATTVSEDEILDIGR
jgi:phosphoglycerate-specific signal transduction histidine kinase